MEKALTVAKTLFNMSGDSINETRMHKIMYFAQRESIIANGKFLFDEDFQGWKYGPVLLDVRQQYFTPTPFSAITENVSPESTDLLREVLKRYGSMSSWTLSDLSHAEISWRMSRKGLKPSENGDKIILKKAIRLDAEIERSKRRSGTSVFQA